MKYYKRLSIDIKLLKKINFLFYFSKFKMEEKIELLIFKNMKPNEGKRIHIKSSLSLQKFIAICSEILGNI